MEEKKFETADEKIAALEQALGPYEKWGDDESIKISDSEDLAKLFDIGVCGKLLERENEIFMPIIFDTFVGNRCQLGYFICKQIMDENDENKQAEVIKGIREKKDPILNIFCDILDLDSNKFERNDEDVKSDIASLKKYLVCISTSLEIENLLYHLICQFEEIYFETFQRNIVEEVVIDEYDMKIDYINQRLAELMNSFEEHSQSEDVPEDSEI